LVIPSTDLKIKENQFQRVGAATGKTSLCTRVVFVSGNKNVDQNSYDRSFKSFLVFLTSPPEIWLCQTQHPGVATSCPNDLNQS